MTKGTSFADIELGEGNANYVKTYDVLVGDKGRKHLMPKRGIAILCWSVPLSSPCERVRPSYADNPFSSFASSISSMDARLDPVSMCGLEVGDAHIIR